MPADTLTLWLVRHADPLIEPGVCYGSLDVPADPAATAASALRLLQALQAQGVRHLGKTIIRVSPLQRAQALSEALHTTWKTPSLPSLIDQRLAEMNFGAWEGQRWDDIPPEELSDWTTDFANYPAGGGETLNQFITRVQAARDHTLFEASRSGRRQAIWITHAGVIRAMTLLQGTMPTTLLATDWPSEAPTFGHWQIQCWPLPAQDTETTP